MLGSGGGQLLRDLGIDSIDGGPRHLDVRLGALSLTSQFGAETGLSYHHSKEEANEGDRDQQSPQSGAEHAGSCGSRFHEGIPRGGTRPRQLSFTRYSLFGLSLVDYASTVSS